MVQVLPQHRQGEILSADHPCISCQKISEYYRTVVVPSQLNNPDDITEEPEIFLVKENGRKLGIFSKQQLQKKKWGTCDILFDTTINLLTFRHKGDKKETTIDLCKRKFSGKSKQVQGLGSSVLELLLVFMDNPSQRFTERVFAN